MKKRITKADLVARIKYLEAIIVSRDANQLDDEANRIEGKPVKIDAYEDIRF